MRTALITALALALTGCATTYELQERCIAALIRKTEILWHLLDSVYAAYVQLGLESGSPVSRA